MLEAIEKLLILQDRDRKIAHLQAELNTIGPQREGLLTKAESTQARLEEAKLKVKQLESDRKKLELDVDAKKLLIERYSLQQFQTKKNEEYRALTHEIDNCKAAIAKFEDEQLELMEQGDAAQLEVVEAARQAQMAKSEAEKQLGALADREKELQRYAQELLSGREQLAAAVDEGVLGRYERLRKTKGDRVIVGVEHSACGGCHMKLPTQIIVSCQGEQEVFNCPNCGRILYWARGMDLAAAE